MALPRQFPPFLAFQGHLDMISIVFWLEILIFFVFLHVKNTKT